jgi:two-component system chemotaxis response regulator CheY
MGKKVMVVDDSRTVRQQVGHVLLQAGYEVVEARDGVEATEKIRDTGDIAMILCDVNMPRMNGIEMLSYLKRDGQNADLLVVMLTTEAQPALITKAKQAGARGWIVKPVKPDMLLATVRKLVGSAA